MSVVKRQITKSASSEADPVLVVEDMVVAYGSVKRPVYAVDHVTFALHQGEMLGIIGESGCGKSTMAYALINLLPSSARVVGGSIRVQGLGDISGLSEREWEVIRGRKIAMVFQAAQSMFNPLMPLGKQMRHVLDAHHVNISEGMERGRTLLRKAQLDPDRVLKAYPHELSGGMRQRVSVVFAILLKPDLLILDEPTTALDVLSQITVLELIQELRRDTPVTTLFITHDFSVVASLADRIAVMYAGQLAEIASTTEIYQRPQHPYTAALTRAVPELDGPLTDLVAIPGQPPNLTAPPPGCRFAPRCPLAVERCISEPPVWTSSSTNSGVACWRGGENGGVPV